MKPSKEQSGLFALLLQLLARFYEPRTAEGKPVRVSGRQWYQRRITFLQILHLIALRTRLRQFNLYDTAWPSKKRGLKQATKWNSDERTIDGSDNDIETPWMGMAGTAFGRNVPRQYTFPETSKRLLSPNPRVVSNRLLRRKEFVPVEQLNLLSAAWVQFMVHDWLGHGENDPHVPIEIHLEKDDRWHENPMKVLRTRRDARLTENDGSPPTYGNVETHWWDGSQIYGSSIDRAREVREGDSARLRLELSSNGELGLPVSVRQKKNSPKHTQIEVAGVNENWWVGLSLMHTLFAQEHNLIVDMLRGTYRNWSEERLYQKARLINAALTAKIHTTEWTPALLPHKAVSNGLRINWWGIMGERRVKKYGRLFRSEFLSGIPGSDTRHHAADYSITEEFVAVYRMHALLPDVLTFSSPEDSQFKLAAKLSEVSGENVQQFYRKVSRRDALFSFGIEHPGAMKLHNYPEELRQLKRQGSSRIVDLATVDILRDRERGIPRYNAFRELIGKPKLAGDDWPGISADVTTQNELKSIYDSVDDVDLMVGLYAEDLIEGFAFSETAFRVFILMANRRLKSDRFYTTDYTPEVYTPEGISWIENRNMADVIGSHYESLKAETYGLKNVFYPWNDNQNRR